MSTKKKNVEGVVSAMGALLAIVVDLVRYIREFGGDVGASIYHLAQPEGKETLRAVAKLIVDGLQKIKDLAVMTLADMIVSAKIDWAHSDICDANFPIDEPVKDEEMWVFHFDREMSYQEVVAAMDMVGWKPAKIWHLLLWCIKNPVLYEQYHIVALGSVWCNFVPYFIWEDVSRRRDLHLMRINLRWFACCHFLAIRK